MALIPAQETYAIRNVFNTYGDTTLGRQKATQVLRDILRFLYGSSYIFIFSGKAVDNNGYITKKLVDYYSTSAAPPGTTAGAMNAIEQNEYLNITFLLPANPRYEYPWYYDFRVTPYSTVDRYEFTPKGIQNLKFNGCKLTGTGINANSADTTDGGPVVKLTKVNQNQIVFSNNTVTTARSNTSGLPVRQITSRNFSSGTSPDISSTVVSAPLD